MTPKDILRTLLYGFLLSTRPQTIWASRSPENQQNEGIAVFDPMMSYGVAPAPDVAVSDFVTRLENYENKNDIQKQLIEDLEEHYQVDYYLDENMLKEIISLQKGNEHNDEINLMYYAHLKTYIFLCNKDLGLPELKRSIIAQYKIVEQPLFSKSKKLELNDIKRKFFDSWKEYKTKPQKDKASFNQDIDADTLHQLLHDATLSIFQDQYQIVIDALKYMSTHQKDRLSFQAKKLMEHALSCIKTETYYSTENIIIPTASLDDANEYVQNKSDELANLLKPLEHKAHASKNAQKIIMDSLPASHTMMLDELKKFLTYAENKNDPFLLREAKIAFYIGHQAFMEFNIHQKSNLQIFKKSTMNQITMLAAYTQDPKMRAPIYPFLSDLREKIAKNDAKQQPDSSIEFFTSFSNQINSGKKLDAEKFADLIYLAEISPLRERYKLLNSILTTIKQQYDINTLSPEIIILMRHSSFMLKKEINEDVTIDRQLTENQFEQGIKKCGLQEMAVLDLASNEASEEIKIEYINYMAKRIIRIFLENKSNDSAMSIFKAIADYFNTPGKLEERDTGYMFFALSLEQINKTTPFTSHNLTEQSWKIIRDYESNLAKQANHQAIYLHTKKLIIEKYSTQANNYNIPTVLILLVIFIFALKKLSSKSIKEIEQTIDLETTKTKFKATTTPGYQAAITVDPFIDLWDKFKKFAKSQLEQVDENISDLLDKHRDHILQKAKSTWLNLDNEQRLLELLNCNIDWLVQHDKSKVDQIMLDYGWKDLSLTLENKRLALEKQKQIDDFKELFNIKPPQVKYDNKNFTKGIKYIKSLIPEIPDDSSLASKRELVSTILRQLKFQSGLNGPEINHILDELDKIYDNLKDNQGYIAPIAVLTQNNNNPDALIPDSLYKLWIPHDSPTTNTPPSTLVVEETKPVARNKVDIILNPPYLAFADNVAKYLDLAFNEYTQLTNRAYKLLIIQFHSLILKDKSIENNPLLNDIRNRFCHKWELIGRSKDLQIILHHILRLINETRTGSLSSIADLDKELQLYPQKILALEKTANPIYKGKASTQEKVIALLAEFDETKKLCVHKELGELAKLAIIDILCEIGEILTHSSINNINPIWAVVRATGYHSDKPKQEIIDKAILEGIPEFKKIFEYSASSSFRPKI